MGLLAILVTAILGVAGLYLGHNLRRQLSLRIADKRFDAYASLWSQTESASPTRLADRGLGPLSEDERETLHSKLLSWYYKNGNGILLNGTTRNLYLVTKENLICTDDRLQPRSVRERVMGTDNNTAARGELSIRQLSLLRTRMKADLAVFGAFYFGQLNGEDREFLRHCGEQLWRKPWRRPLVSGLRRAAGEE